ncbi:MAG: hypothetical protein U9N31_07960, partial [Candidatus Marinimicrobia bacterium]|nr:hypothetical protein [Candidatus Neomarinimicrobiota bacterium]
MKHLVKLIPILAILASCTKTTPIGDLKGVEGIAIDPNTEEPFSGEAYLNFFDGQLRMQGMYEKGKKVGLWQYFIKGSENRFYKISFIDGEIVSVNYNEGDRTWNGNPIAFTPDSSMVDGKYLVQELEQYDYSLSPNVFVQLVNNKAEGTLTRWYENGQIYSDGTFLNGERNGQITWWYKSGVLKETSTWHDGHQVGLVTQWYENGNKFAEARYVKGKLTGKLIWWYENRQKKEEVNFIDGNRDGYAYWWYENGSKKGVADISSGLGVITLFSEDKKIASRFDVKDNHIFCNSCEI